MCGRAKQACAHTHFMGCTCVHPALFHLLLGLGAWHSTTIAILQPSPCLHAFGKARVLCAGCEALVPHLKYLCILLDITI